jgi:hypothetical protein
MIAIDAHDWLQMFLAGYSEYDFESRGCFRKPL